MKKEEVREQLVQGLKQVMAAMERAGWQWTEEEKERTPERIARWWLEWAEAPPPTLTTFGTTVDEIVAVSGVQFASLCSHHLVPYEGRAGLAYLPAGRIVGLSKIPRLIKWCAARPTVQEQLTQEIVNMFVEKVRPSFVIIVMEAKHGCVSCRGVEEKEARMRTSAMWWDRTRFGNDPTTVRSLKEEALRLLLPL